MPFYTSRSRTDRAGTTRSRTGRRMTLAVSMAERRVSYTIEVWDADGNHIVEHVGSLSNHAAARATFAAACDARPDHYVTPRQGIRVVEQRGLDSGVDPVQLAQAAPLDPAV